MAVYGIKEIQKLCLGLGMYRPIRRTDREKLSPQELAAEEALRRKQAHYSNMTAEMVEKRAGILEKNIKSASSSTEKAQKARNEEQLALCRNLLAGNMIIDFRQDDLESFYRAAGGELAIAMAGGMSLKEAILQLPADYFFIFTAEDIERRVRSTQGRGNVPSRTVSSDYVGKLTALYKECGDDYISGLDKVRVRAGSEAKDKRISSGSTEIFRPSAFRDLVAVLKLLESDAKIQHRNNKQDRTLNVGEEKMVSGLLSDILPMIEAEPDKELKAPMLEMTVYPEIPSYLKLTDSVRVVDENMAEQVLSGVVSIGSGRVSREKIIELAPYLNMQLELPGEAAASAARSAADEAARSENLKTLFRRGRSLLEQGQWAKAGEVFEQMLDMDPENADAFTGKLLAEMQAADMKALGESEKDFTQSKSYELARRYADNELAVQLDECVRSMCLNQQNRELNRRANLARSSQRAAQAFWKQGSPIGSAADDLLKSAREKYTLALDQFRAVGISHQIVNEGIKDCETCITAIDTELDRRAKERKRSRKIRNSLLSLAAVAAAAVALLWRPVIQPQIYLSSLSEKMNRQEYEIGRALVDIAKYSPEEIRDNPRITARKKELADLYVKQQKEMAEAALAKGNVAEAYRKYAEIQDPGDGSVDELKSLRQKLGEQYPRLSSLLEKGTAEIGSYEQDGIPDNGPEPLEWQIMGVNFEKETATLITRYGINSMQVNTSQAQEGTVTWKNCSIRDWLNGEFYENTFDSREKSLINLHLTSDLYTINNQDNEESVEDYVYILSVDDDDFYSHKYPGFSGFGKRFNDWWISSPTEYAIQRGAKETSNGYFYVQRPARFDRNTIHLIKADDGELFTPGYQTAYWSCSVDAEGNMVRPSIEINLRYLY